MINGKSTIAIIPARGGSKGLPGKNIRTICGKPLIAWSIEQAKNARHLDYVLVTTDCPSIAQTAVKYGASVPFLRPPELSMDHATTIDAVRHSLDYLSRQEKRKFDYTVLLEPTSPLRENDDIDRMLAALDNNADQFDAIVSVGEVKEHPSITKRLVGNRLEPFCAELTATSRRQDNIPAYFPYGVAYIAKTPTLLAENTFYPRRCMSYQIQRYQNYEIDDLLDFICVESIMKHEWELT